MLVERLFMALRYCADRGAAVIKRHSFASERLQMTVGRYAPSPTGELHLGNARTALAAYLACRSVGGRFVMRVEDLDGPRNIPGAEERILETLRFMGMDWDEGPDVSGPHAPYRQSERFARYEEALAGLVAAGRAYGCRCSRQDLARLASAPHGPGNEGPVYPGTCREAGLVPGERLDRDRVVAARFRVAPGVVAFEDALAGRFAQDVAQAVGDFVIKRADGVWAYQLAVVVDDAAMGVNQVVRGADLLDSTPRQIQLLEALGQPVPAYAHVPLVVDAEGKRLAKRDGATALASLRERGMSQGRLLGLLGHSLGLVEGGVEATMPELVRAFAWERVPPAPWRVMPEGLAWLTG